jgi:ribonuclease P protein component
MELRTLGSRRDFDHVWRTGHRARRNGILVSAVPASTDAGRVGLIARAPGAVVRNRIKRRLRAALMECDAAGMDAVVSADESVANMRFDELLRALQASLERARREMD